MIIYSLEELIKQNINKETKISGIYIWGVQISETKYIPLYVGKARKIPQRIIEHLCAWKGGAYQVPLWDDVIGAKKDWKILHRQLGFIDFKLQMESEEVQKTIKNVLSGFFCCWKNLDNYQNLTTKEIIEIEDALAGLLLENQSLISHTKGNSKTTQFSTAFYDEWTKKTCP